MISVDNKVSQKFISLNIFKCVFFAFKTKIAVFKKNLIFVFKSFYSCCRDEVHRRRHSWCIKCVALQHRDFRQDVRVALSCPENLRRNNFNPETPARTRQFSIYAMATLSVYTLKICRPAT